MCKKIQNPVEVPQRRARSEPAGEQEAHEHTGCEVGKLLDTLKPGSPPLGLGPAADGAAFGQSAATAGG